VFTYNKLRGRIVEKYGSMKSFYEENTDVLGVSYVTMSQKMNNKCKFSQDDIEIWRNLLDIKKSEIGEYFFT